MRALLGDLALIEHDDLVGHGHRGELVGDDDQRALAAKDIREAQKGIYAAALLKFLTPAIVVLPGIIAYKLYGTGTLYTKLAEANKLADPYIIYIGQILTVPAK